MDYKELIVNLRSLHAAINPLAHQAAAAIEALEAQVNTCGAGAGCLHKDARIEALEATNSANMATCKGIIQGLESEVEADNRNLEQLSDEVNALRAQLTAAEQAQPEPSKIEPWQPMKTAPKDGVAVMVLLEGSDIPHAARWLNGVDDVHATVETVGAGWHLTWDGSPVSEYSGPRCWMCCPDEPYDKFAQQTAPRFAKTYCSQCGKEFCAGNYGFSHCEDHAKQAQPERAPLTFEQIDEIWVAHGLDHCGAHAFARAIEAAHGIKQGGAA